MGKLLTHRMHSSLWRQWAIAVIWKTICKGWIVIWTLWIIIKLMRKLLICIQIILMITAPNTAFRFLTVSYLYIAFHVTLSFSIVLGKCIRAQESINWDTAKWTVNGPMECKKEQQAIQDSYAKCTFTFPECNSTSNVGIHTFSLNFTNDAGFNPFSLIILLLLTFIFQY